MKYFAISALLFIVTNCLAVNQKLIDAAKFYDNTLVEINKINTEISIQNDELGYWSKKLDEDYGNSNSSDYSKNLHHIHIDETRKQIQNLSIQYNNAKEALKTLEPLKNEYDKQIEVESKREKLKTEILNITGMVILPLAFFGIIILLGIYKHKKYKRLLRNCKISQREYDNIMRNRSTMFDDERTNPATGLRMIGGIDSGGNPSGCSFKSGSSFDIHQDYRDRHRWD